MWDKVDEGAEPERIGKFVGKHPLTAGDLYDVVDALKRLAYPRECPVQIRTPLPPRDRRVVDLRVLDFTPPPQEEQPNGR